LGDEDRLRQLISNLLQNALRYASAAPGVVSVTVEGDAAQARLIVEDDGPGIPPEAMERVFDRFFRLDRGRSRPIYEPVSRAVWQGRPADHARARFPD
jgi:signal transduction histidine kinase